MDQYWQDDQQNQQNQTSTLLRMQPIGETSFPSSKMLLSQTPDSRDPASFAGAPADTSSAYILPHTSTHSSVGFSPMECHHHQQGQSTHVNHELRPILLGGLLLTSTIITLFFVTFTIFATLPNIPTRRPGWYVGNDILRLLEPIVSLPFQFFILLESGIFQRRLNLGNTIAIVVFMVAAALYQQGAGLHTASIMFKHTIQTAVDDADAGSLLPLLLEIKSWIRDLWEHIISHYMYAIGGIIVSFVNAYVFRHYTVPVEVSRSRLFRLVWVANTFFYGLIVGAVAIQFPKGSIVALCLITIYGFMILGSFLYYRGYLTLNKLGSLPVLQSYFGSYIVG
ncbi:hypothetical protein BSLG_000358 [Batrachochytrium salamandrivorans]|nr:hypothetical protein BSLG_000358 [Batrachochytrium salamandrivorans]